LILSLDFNSFILYGCAWLDDSVGNGEIEFAKDDRNTLASEVALAAEIGVYRSGRDLSFKLLFQAVSGPSPAVQLAINSVPDSHNSVLKTDLAIPHNAAVPSDIARIYPLLKADKPKTGGV
jgi:hypothetical protein